MLHEENQNLAKVCLSVVLVIALLGVGAGFVLDAHAGPILDASLENAFAVPIHS